MIFIASQSVKEVMSKEIPESDHVSYISTGKNYDTYKGIMVSGHLRTTSKGCLMTVELNILTT